MTDITILLTSSNTLFPHRREEEVEGEGKSKGGYYHPFLYRYPKTTCVAVPGRN